MKESVIVDLQDATSRKKNNAVLLTKDLNVWHKNLHILKNVNAEFMPRTINCIIGPSGAGKSTLIRSINRINENVQNIEQTGEIYFKGTNINTDDIDLAWLRTRIGMVFQKPCVFPRSIVENVLFGRQDLKQLGKKVKIDIVEKYLRAAYLWKETSHRLNNLATTLSVGQQQRLCVARTLAVNPEMILLDEPTSALDPVSTRALEKLILELKQQYTIVFVTHNIGQARRIADQLIFMCDGRIIEQGPAKAVFDNPASQITQNYLSEEYCDC